MAHCLNGFIVEAESWAGSGSQAGAAWDRGVAIVVPFIDDEAINQVLRAIGVTRRGCDDEFATLGLGRHRLTDDWNREAR